jgi:hypothetical protein
MRPKNKEPNPKKNKPKTNQEIKTSKNALQSIISPKVIPTYHPTQNNRSLQNVDGKNRTLDQIQNPDQ